MAKISLDKLIRYFLYHTVLNVFAAVAFTTPVIIPILAFPLKLTVWPGTWMFISYFVFLIVGVLGTLGWTSFLYLIKQVTGAQYCDKFLAVTSIVLIEVAVYIQTTLMFVVGYVGGTYAFATLFGQAVITYMIGPLVVPIGVSIFVYLIGTLLGLMNVVLILAPGTRSSTAPQIERASSMPQPISR